VDGADEAHEGEDGRVRRDAGEEPEDDGREYGEFDEDEGGSGSV